MELIKKPIRIAQVIGKMWSGGVEMVIFNYYRSMDKTQIQFDFYYDSDSTVEPPQDLIDMGARFYKIPPYQKLPQYIHELRRCFKENHYLIVHSHLNTLSIFPLFVAWTCHVPVRIAHNHSVPSGSEFGRDALKYFLRLGAKIFPTDYFACSEKAGRWMFGDKAFNTGLIFIMKNAVDFERFKYSSSSEIELREKFGLKDKFVIEHVGRFTYAKNHTFLLDVFLEITKKKKNAMLLLVGDGELHNDIVEKVKKRGLEQKVIFAGQVSNPEEYYPLANVIVLPSLFEGLSLATIESQIVGIPVVVSEAIPKEAVISNGVKRLKLSNSEWVDEILEIADKKVILNKSSEEYDIKIAVKKLEKWYINKMKEVSDKNKE